MKFKQAARLFIAWQFRALAVPTLLALLPGHAQSQTTAASSSTTVRGLAKLEGKYVIDKVMVVVTPLNPSGSPVGNPVPAWANNIGEYRIEHVTPGDYDIRAYAQDKPMEGELTGVKIAQGNSNVFNISLKKAQKTSRMQFNAVDAFGRPAIGAKIYVYPAALPPSVCAECKLAEVAADEQGALAPLELAAGQSYIFALDASAYWTGVKFVSSSESNLVATEKITLGEAPEARIKLQIREGRHPSLMATSLPADSYSPATPQRLQNAQASVDRRGKHAINLPSFPMANAGDEAFRAGSYDEAVAFYTKGLSVREEVHLYINRAAALRLRGIQRNNAALQSKDESARQAGLDAAFQDWQEANESAGRAMVLIKSQVASADPAERARQAHNMLAALYVRAETLRLISRVDTTQVQKTLDAYKELIAAEPDPSKKSKFRLSSIQMLVEARASSIAIAEGRKFLAEEPTNPDASYILGLALYGSGSPANYREAALYLQRYLDRANEADPMTASARAALKSLMSAAAAR